MSMVSIVKRARASFEAFRNPEQALNILHNSRPLISFFKENSSSDEDAVVSRDDPYARWFYFDSKVYRCIVINAGFSTLTAGFNTVLERNEKLPLPEGVSEEEYQKRLEKKYGYILSAVNNVNKTVNLDMACFHALIKIMIFGRAGFHILRKTQQPENSEETTTNGLPDGLVPLEATVSETEGLQPVVDRNKRLKRFKLVKGKKTTVLPKDNVLYFAYMDLNGNKRGISPLSQILATCKLRQDIKNEHYPRALSRMWKMPVIASVDTEGFGDTDDEIEKEKALINEVTRTIDSGRNFAVNKSITLNTPHLTVNIAQIMALEKTLGEEIIGHFGTAPFLVNQLSANFATAHVEYDSYIAGTVNDWQQFLKRALEADWYPSLVKMLINQQNNRAVDFDFTPEIVVKHVFKPVKRTSDMSEMVKIANDLLLLCGGDRVLAAKTAGLTALSEQLSSSRMGANENKEEEVDSSGAVEGDVGVAARKVASAGRKRMYQVIVPSE